MEPCDGMGAYADDAIAGERSVAPPGDVAGQLARGQHRPGRRLRGWFVAAWFLVVVDSRGGCGCDDAGQVDRLLFRAAVRGRRRAVLESDAAECRSSARHSVCRDRPAQWAPRRSDVASLPSDRRGWPQPRQRDWLRRADAPLAATASSDRRAAMGRRAALRAGRVYDWHRIGRATLDVYRSVVGDRTGTMRAEETA